MLGRTSPNVKPAGGVKRREKLAAANIDCFLDGGADNSSFGDKVDRIDTIDGPGCFEFSADRREFFVVDDKPRVPCFAAGFLELDSRRFVPHAVARAGPPDRISMIL